MSYKARIRSSIRRRIVTWKLSDAVFVEVMLRLEQDLTRNPAEKLTRTRAPFDGMTYQFSLVDPDNRFCEHQFFFQVLYGQDEETLHVVNCGYHLWGIQSKRTSSAFPLGHLPHPQRLIAQMSCRSGADPGLGRSVRSLATAHALNPVRQM
jgi:hypothetical protein